MCVCVYICVYMYMCVCVHVDMVYYIERELLAMSLSVTFSAFFSVLVSS